ncbi:MAG: mechanosensitive ion channel, partial [Candidatus Eisenbacteria bacterium]|nr:mechanosensitive ion channel [Candidatus Eisenbacteria bacterium]
MEPEALQRTVDVIVPWVTQYGLQVIGAVLILIAGKIASNIVGSTLRKTFKRGRMDPSLQGFLVRLAQTAILAFEVVAALAKFGIQTTSFVAILGAAGFAVGFALQGSLSNFAAGVLLLVFRPVEVGDMVETNGYLGIVKEIGLFVTTMNTLDNQRIIIPNATLTSGVINNVNGNGTRRVDLTAGISYGDDTVKARNILMKILQEHPCVLKDTVPHVGVFEMADSSVNLTVRPWCKAEDYWTVW